jgi:hypothetical protein
MSRQLPGHSIVLTDPRGDRIKIPASDLIAYGQELGFTRLVLVGRRVLDVQEGTDHIDRLMRTAADPRAIFE